MIGKIKHWYNMTKAIFRGQPVRTWRRFGDQNGEPECYVCDGDCGVYSLHGVCTCGLSHYFKPFPNGRKKVLRSNVSWRRERQTESVMMYVDRVVNCEHGLSLDSFCPSCIAAFMKEVNDQARPTSLP